MPPRAHLLVEANRQQLLNAPPAVAVLPWGATEAHNLHMPYGTDLLLASRVAERAAEIAAAENTPVAVLPGIPYGNDEQQLDQMCTVSFRTSTALAVLDDVVRSLVKQGVDRLVIVNGHGGNHFQPLVRDLQGKYPALIVVANYFVMLPEVSAEIFDNPGDHADEFETSLMMHLYPELVELSQAGDGRRIPFAIEALKQPGIWTPRPWSASHPDTGSGDPSASSADKGKRFFEAVTQALANVLTDLARAEKGQIPYL